MKAIAYNEFGSSTNLQLMDLDIPEPKDDEVLIKLAYAGVNPVDWKTREGHLTGIIEHRFPLIPGWDGAGEIVKVGKNITNFKEKDVIWGYFRGPLIQWGTYAEYTVANSSQITLKPHSLGVKEAAALPLVSLTAWQSLFDFAELKEDQVILIHAAAGGVGGMAVQLAKWKGAKVIATAREENHEYVRSLGADICIDYTKQSFVKETLRMFPQGIDVVYDCVGGKTGEESYQVIKQGGCFISIVDFEVAQVQKPGLKIGFVFVTPNSDQLDQLKDLIEAKVIRPPFITEMGILEASKAQDLIKTGHVRGKIVLKI